jgi:hypothetical protein
MADEGREWIALQVIGSLCGYLALCEKVTDGIIVSADGVRFIHDNLDEEGIITFSLVDTTAYVTILRREAGQDQPSQECCLQFLQDAIDHYPHRPEFNRIRIPRGNLNDFRMDNDRGQLEPSSPILQVKCRLLNP